MKKLLLLLLCISTPALANPAPTSWRAPDPENVILVTTSKGDIFIEIAPGFAENHARQIRTLIRSGLYQQTTFHRVIDGFMAQGGKIQTSPLPNLKAEFTFRRNPKQQPAQFLGNPDNGSKQAYLSGFPILTQPEFLAQITQDKKVTSWMRHCPGTASMARTNNPNSANSQFFLVTHTSPWLDRKYTAWGRVIHGMKTVRSLNKGQPPENPDKILAAKLLADIPENKRPKIRIKNSRHLRKKLDDAWSAGKTDICDLEPVIAEITP